VTPSDPLGIVAAEVAARLQAVAKTLGDASELREVRHLEPAVVGALRDAYPNRTVAKNRKHPIPSWSPVGNVDVVMQPATDRDSLVAIELKWCHVDKLYEAIWDLFKMALLSTTGAWTYLVTGAPLAVWREGVGRELFDDAVHVPVDLCQVRLPWGQKLRAWDDLLWGGYDKCPDAVPAQISTRVIAREAVTVGWELRAVRVGTMGEATTAFNGGWPFPRPADAMRPLGES
jgi:hypothetical protein